MMHIVGGFYCSVSVLYGNPHIHRRNGGYIAKTEDEQTVYVSCPFCVFDPSRATKNPLAVMVPETAKSTHPWVIYTEEVYEAIARAVESHGQGQKMKRMKKK